MNERNWEGKTRSGHLLLKTEILLEKLLGGKLVIKCTAQVESDSNHCISVVLFIIFKLMANSVLSIYSKYKLNGLRRTKLSSRTIFF